MIDGWFTCSNVRKKVSIDHWHDLFTFSTPLVIDDLFFGFIDHSFIHLFIAGEKYETDMLQQLRSGTYHLILSETLEQLHSAVESLSTKKIHLSRPLAKKYLKTHLRTIDQQKRSELFYHCHDDC